MIISVEALTVSLKPSSSSWIKYLVVYSPMESLSRPIAEFGFMETLQYRLGWLRG
jgi:hypothetical protein